MANITVLGAGAFGLALALSCRSAGHEVTVWSEFESKLEEIRTKGESSKLKGVRIPKDIALTPKITAVAGEDVVVMGIPSSFVRSVAKEVSPHLTPGTVIVNTSKGIEADTYKRMSEVIREECPENPIVVITGPSHAEEVSIGVPTTVVAACEEPSYAEYIQDLFTTETLRIYINEDVVGCELGGAMKNIIALACGISDGMGFGDNTKAALMTRGIHEITYLGLALGAKYDTFSGLTGIGDLIVTCTSMHSRNRRAGILIGEGISPEEAVRRVGTVEGYYCCKAAYHLSRKLGVSMPITEEVYRLLYEKGDIGASMHNLMSRPSRHKREHYMTDGALHKEEKE